MSTSFDGFSASVCASDTLANAGTAQPPLDGGAFLPGDFFDAQDAGRTHKRSKTRMDDEMAAFMNEMEVPTKDALPSHGGDDQHLVDRDEFEQL